MHLVEPQESEGPASEWSRASDGRAVYGDGWHSGHSDPTGDECSGSTR